MKFLYYENLELYGKLYVASILRIKVLSTFAMLHAGAGEEYDPKQQETVEFIDNAISKRGIGIKGQKTMQTR